ncbi:LLM class flavin-dependent oxidoreductase [Mycolicibacterium mageritense]|uniref:FMNH(2)-dependent dimethylsulfone monooxygenase n=1 Tax=Mycolicibacterium mageritense TaxID=53462 RepID=A0AAI8TZ50_MYCME|nr:LLM class flavin-dependent oxidoreductase [Mycolicibacterium mageritense]TXI53697.1 MAG: LLM class flavin-dependent oxidoreductase [Mycolicibacterium mageritense]BDY31192.1 FMNH(2)-dependent dimethylsulfone monooxygenase [Mycolicibacterium mageritense]
MKFGVDIPTCLAGMAYPVPFAGADEVVRIAVEAEQLGYDEVAGNDHLSTQQFVRQAWQAPPDYYEPLIMLATIAARTSVVRLGTGILVLPMRDPVLLAKQVATLDQISGGRVNLAVAAGGYRDEFESVVPDLADASRSDLMAEGIDALRVLFEQPRSTFEGKYRRFVDVESYPKPVQSPLPIFSGGNATGALRRAGERCDGWLPAKIGPAEIGEGRERIAQYARAAGRDPAAITIGLQTVVCIADTAEQAREKFERSTFELFRGSLSNTMMKGVDLDKYLSDNLIGTPEEVCAKAAAFDAAGLDGFYATLFVADTVDEMLDQMRRFAQHVIPEFRDRHAEATNSR